MMKPSDLPRLACLTFIAVVSAALPSLAHAGGCTVTASGVAFGQYSVFSGGPTSTTGTLSYTCTLPVEPPVIKLSQGHSLSFTPRALSATSGTLSYNLYLNASCTTIWGDGTSGTSAYSAPAPANGQLYSVTIYGLIPARQNVRAGTYVDSVVVTIEF
jgi:spore coat protein U-like protein